MNIYKKGIALSLATCIALSPIAVMAENEEIIPISAPISAIDEDEVMVREYIEFRGKIEEIQNEDGQFSIVVKNDTKEGFDAIIANVSNDVIILDEKDMEFADKAELKEGVMVSIFYHKNTIMTRSIPPILGPDAIVIDNTDENFMISVMVSKFDKELLNAEKDMIIRPSDETIIVDKDGNKVDKDDLENRDLIVFYDIVLTSYPGQTSPKKIVVMPSVEEIETPEAPEAPEEVKEFILENEFVKVIDGVKMIPLRLVAENLGYELTWNQESKSAELVKGPQWTSVTIGQDRYNFAKMLVELGTAPVLVDSKTYVPMNFIEEILKAKVDVVPEGLKIVY